MAVWTRIIELLPSKDGVVRVVKIRTKNGEYVLPTVKIYPLEGITNEVPQGGR